ncbi:MAG: L-threonylcarbamoyladenylate synthase [Acidimicrobiia bacterium]
MSVAEAVDVLRRGGLVAFPTETVYGLGCDAEAPAAIARLYAVKRRPLDHPVIVHLPDTVLADPMIAGWAESLPATARVLAEALWPGPLTLLVRRGRRVLDAVTGGRDTVGLRIPDHPVARELLRAFGGGIAAPSANRFGRVSPTSAEDVRADLDGDVDLVLDGGSSRIGVESTIVDCTGATPAIVRLGGITREQVEDLAGPTALVTAGAIAAPGTLPAHYAPTARVVIADAATVAARATRLLASGATVGVLAFGGGAGDLPDEVVVLASPSDDDEYARVLYPSLRAADAAHLDVVLAVLPEAVRIGAAVADRLQRAAS